MTQTSSSALTKRIQSGNEPVPQQYSRKSPKDRDEFEPMRKLEGGSKVLVLNSNTDMPKDKDLLDLKTCMDDG